VEKEYSLLELAAAAARRTGKEECPEAVALMLLAGAFDQQSVLHNLLPALKALQEGGTAGQQGLLHELLMKLQLFEGKQVTVDKREVESKGSTYK
jgi:hypothetical protein